MWADAQKGNRNRLMVAKEYASILDGVSYVEPLVFDGPHFDLATACEQLAGNAQDWVSTQVNGPKDMVARYTYQPANQKGAVTTSHGKESWRVCGRLNEWDNCYPLVFDQRDREREEKLCESIIGRRKKFILLAAKGNTSPFQFVPLLRELLKHSGFTVLDISDLSAEKPYDLLGLYERATCLVAIDSAPLHFARACPSLPVVALVNDTPALWNGSPWQPNFVFYCRYRDFPNRAVDMLMAIRNCDKLGSLSRARQFSEECFVHVWDEYEGPFEHRDQWMAEFHDRWIATPVVPGMCGRDSKMIPDEERRLPFLVDCIRMGLQRARDQDWVMLTRSNIVPIVGLAQQLSTVSAAYSYRTQGDPARFFPVHDLFCAKKGFWQSILAQIPNHIWGTDFHWSNSLWALFRDAGAHDLTTWTKRIGEGEPKAKVIAPAESGELKDPPRLIHNQALDVALMRAKNVYCRFAKVSLQRQTKIVRTKFACGYNPSMALMGETLWFAYRYHMGATLQSQIAIGIFDKDLQLYEEKHLPLPGKSREDPKLFVHRGIMHISWVDATYPEKPFKSIVRYAAISPAGVGNEFTLAIGKNDWSTMEKNWVFFSHEKQLYVIYHTVPDQQIYRISDSGAELLPSVPGPEWAYGEVRGGTTPVRHHPGQLIRFFHSSMDNEFGRARRRYFVGAYTMEDKPPFTPIAITRQPLIYGSELDDIPSLERKAALQYKRQVVFPGGVVGTKDGWLLAVGINDAACGLVNIRREDVEI
jgi:predicted GH43/DUF377 family glycosyl hydrolase